MRVVAPQLSDRAAGVLRQVFADVQAAFAFRLWDGTLVPFGSGAPAFTVVIHAPDTFLRLMRDPTPLTFGEAYVQSTIDIEGDLFAAMHVARRATDAAFHAAAAKLVSTGAAKLNCADNVQNHGAIGFTVEHDAGLFARRAHMWEFTLGGREVADAATLEPSRHRFHALPDAPADWFDQGV